MPTWYFEKDCDLKDFKASIANGEKSAVKPQLNTKVEQGIPVYNCAELTENITWHLKKSWKWKEPPA